MNIEPEKRFEIIMNHYRMFNKYVDALPLEKLDKLCDNYTTTEIPYEIYVEVTEDANTKVPTIYLIHNCGNVKRDNQYFINISVDITALCLQLIDVTLLGCLKHAAL